MNEIQKENAKVAIEYWQKVLAGESPLVQVRLKQGAAMREWFSVVDESQNSIFNSKNYESRIAPKPQEMVEHKGGSYPKPVDALDIVEGRTYYIAYISLVKDMSFSIAASASSDAFQLAVKRKTLHETKEAAIQHAKVMLGVGDET